MECSILVRVDGKLEAFFAPDLCINVCALPTRELNEALNEKR